MNKTISSVMDISEPWDNPHGGQVWYITAFTTDGEVLSAGRKDEDAALELQGLLREAIGVEQDFVLEPDKPTKLGKTKWKILGFGTPGGAATYTAPGVQGGSGSEPGRGSRPQTDVSARRPEPNQASIRASVALKAAVDACHGLDINAILEYADAFNAWMLEKTSEPALSEYAVGSPRATANDQAGADSEDSSGELSSLSTPDEGGGGVDLKGREPAPPPHQHDWQLRQGVRGFLVCDCGATRKKETE